MASTKWAWQSQQWRTRQKHDPTYPPNIAMLIASYPRDPSQNADASSPVSQDVLLFGNPQTCR